MALIKSIGKIFIAIGFGIFISMMLLEIILRIYVNTPILHTIGYLPRPMENLYTLMPNQNGMWASDCYYIDPITTNSIGFRDLEPTKKVKIAILGDSYMEALQIPEHENTSDLLRTLTSSQVMNTGISGFGPLHEYLTYNEIVRPYKPDIVLLFFYSGNDVRDSSCVLNRSGGSVWDLFKACATINRTGAVKIHQEISPPSSFFNPQVKLLIKEYCRSCDFLIYVYSNLENKFYMAKHPHVGHELSRDLHVYMKPDAKWNDAWKITEYFLKKLNDQVKRDGGHLVIVTVPDYGRISRNTLKKMREAGFRLPPDYDPFLPIRRLESISKNDGFDLLELENFFLKYRDRYQMKSPYFFYRCDGHWSPLGHFLASNVIVKYLVDNKYIEDQGGTLSRSVDRMLAMSPQEILGKKAYGQIFDNGTYRGNSNINNILRREK